MSTEDIEQTIKDVQSEIEEISKKIKNAESEFSGLNEGTKKDDLRRTLDFERQKEAQLRRKEEQLTDLLLLREKERLGERPSKRSRLEIIQEDSLQNNCNIGSELVRELTTIKDTRKFLYNQFWYTDCCSQSVPEQGATFEISEGVSRLFGLGYLKSIIIREAYVKIGNIIEKEIEQALSTPSEGSINQSTTSNVIVTGTPGVGKSCFLLYQLCVAKHKKRNVVVQTGEMFSLFLSSPSCAVGDLTYNDDLLLMLTKPDTLFFYDPGSTKTPLKSAVTAFTIVLSSVNPDNYRRLNKENTKTLYMPVWSLDELTKCAHLYKVDPITVEDSYKIWGGSPRSVFCMNNETLMSSLEEILESDLVKVLVSQVQRDMVDRDARDKSQWLLHISVSGDSYTEKCIDFPSQYIKGKIVEILHIRKYDWKSKPSLMGGRLFEFVVGKQLLQWKGKMEPISLSDNQSVLQVAPPTPSLPNYFSNSDLIHNQSKALYIPIESNKTSGDFVYDDWIFQATIAQKHDVKAKGIIALSRQFSKRAWKLCFCIPTIRLKDYTKAQTITDRKALTDEGIEVTQYKLEIKELTF